MLRILLCRFLRFFLSALRILSGQARLALSFGIPVQNLYVSNGRSDLRRECAEAIELRALGYGVSTCTLKYDAVTDSLRGVYDQVAAKQKFEVIIGLCDGGLTHHGQFASGQLQRAR